MAALNTNAKKRLRLVFRDQALPMQLDDAPRGATNADYGVKTPAPTDPVPGASGIRELVGVYPPGVNYIVCQNASGLKVWKCTGNLTPGMLGSSAIQPNNPTLMQAADLPNAQPDLAATADARKRGLATDWDQQAKLKSMNARNADFWSRKSPL